MGTSLVTSLVVDGVLELEGGLGRRVIIFPFQMTVLFPTVSSL